MKPSKMNQATFRVTALWAFSECALGGVMHALKIPFTGIFVGGFAVLSIGLLAHVSGRNMAVILHATLLVILVKAIVSPHSPPTAYLAVGFQGVVGALILCNLRPFALAAYFFGFLAITESALQKILVLWLFFGKSLFEAFDLFVTDVLENFGIQSQISWSMIAVSCYVGLYALWGLALGFWINKLPDQLERRASEYANLNLSASEEVVSEKKKSKSKWLFPLIVLIFIVLTFLLAGGKTSGTQRALYAVLRTTAVLAAWFFLVQPLVTWFFQRWAKQKSALEKGNLQQIIEFMPSLRAKAGPLYRHISERHNDWRRFPEFVVAMFVVAIYGE